MKAICPTFKVFVHGQSFFGYMAPANDNKVVVGFVAEVGCGNVKYAFRQDRPVGFVSRCGGYDPDLWALAARIVRDSSFVQQGDGAWSFATTSQEVTMKLHEMVIP